MKNYKATHLDPETFELSLVETKIPDKLIEFLKAKLDEAEGYLVTPIMADKEGSSIAWGVMDLENRKPTYKITVTVNDISLL